jgi:hypothetical protein
VLDCYDIDQIKSVVEYAIEKKLEEVFSKYLPCLTGMHTYVDTNERGDKICTVCGRKETYDGRAIYDTPPKKWLP